MTTAPIETVRQGQPFSPEQTRDIIDRFNRDGYVLLPGVLSPEEVEGFKLRIDRAFNDPRMAETHNLYGPYIMARLFELDVMFRDNLVREPVIGLMEALLGNNCHIIAQNFVRNRPGEAIDAFHADDFVWYPLPAEIPRFDARQRIPTFIVNVHHALTDVSSDEFGPLQVVPGSHYSGRPPSDPKNPTFDGRGFVSVHAKPGDVYLQHPQVWHRGAPNTSSRTRYILGAAYGMRFVSQRFYPFLNYQMPAHVLEGASDRLLRVLGKHQKGAFG
ncbi:MAG: phytanoyl-CoA dioxygenase family protein [Planctomycetota bacterium]|nr:phytanoyl-CoA dioxygenase family protein [Planctomycetota bacterium]